jgi:hypothetical protein
MNRTRELELELGLRRDDALDQRRQIDFKIGLESRAAALDVAGNEPPQPAVGQDAEIASAAVQIPFDLLRGVFTLAADLLRPVEADMPGLGVGDDSGMQPEIRIAAPGHDRIAELAVAGEQGVVGLAARCCPNSDTENGK